MKIIRESISFERGLDPKQALGIGLYSKKFNPSFDDLLLYPVGTKLIVKRFPQNISLLTYNPRFTENNFLVYEILNNNRSLFKIKTNFYWEKTVELAKEGFSHNYDFENGKDILPIFNEGDIDYIQAIEEVNESLDFQRGLDPKQALGVGKYRTILNPSFNDLLNLSKGYYILDKKNNNNVSKYCIIHVNDKREFFIGSIWEESPESAIKQYSIVHKNSKFSYGLKWKENHKDIWNHDIISAKYIDSTLFESVNFQRGLDPKQALGVGIKEVNRNLNVMVNNFKDHFSSKGLHFLDSVNIIEREPRKYTGYKTDEYPIFIQIFMDTKSSYVFDPMRKGKQIIAWFKKNTPYKLQLIRKGNAFWNRTSPSGYQTDYGLYLSK